MQRRFTLQAITAAAAFAALPFASVHAQSGGTIKVVGSNLDTSVAAALTASTSSTVNTNGLNARWTGVLSGGGSFHCCSQHVPKAR